MTEIHWSKNHFLLFTEKIFIMHILWGELNTSEISTFFCNSISLIKIRIVNICCAPVVVLNKLPMWSSQQLYALDITSITPIVPKKNLRNIEDYKLSLDPWLGRVFIPCWTRAPSDFIIMLYWVYYIYWPCLCRFTC